MKYRKKPIVVDAHQMNDFDVDTWPDWLCNSDEYFFDPVDRLFLRTLEGVLKCPRGWWVIKGIKGELYPCDPDIFERTYDAVDDDAPIRTTSLPPAVIDNVARWKADAEGSSRNQHTTRIASLCCLVESLRRDLNLKIGELGDAITKQERLKDRIIALGGDLP